MLGDPSIQWGTVGEWVSGIGSILAVVTALWLTFYQLAKARRDHAAKVWVEVIPNLSRDGEPWNGIGAASEVGHWHTIVHNDSPMAIFRAEVSLRLSTGTTVSSGPGVPELQAIGLGKSDGHRILDGESSADTRASEVTLTFEDSDGRRWRNVGGRVVWDKHATRKWYRLPGRG